MTRCGAPHTHNPHRYQRSQSTQRGWRTVVEYCDGGSMELEDRDANDAQDEHYEREIENA